MKFNYLLVLCLLISSVSFAQSVTVKTDDVKVEQTYAKFIGKTPPLRDLIPRPTTTSERRAQNKLRRAPRNFIGRGRPFDINPDALPKGVDKIRQSSKKSLNSFQIEPLVDRNGISRGSSPHDPTGDIGENYYIQAVNATTFQIFHKDGVAASNPIAANTLWASIGFSSAGDPIVLYDQEEKRWLITEFPSGNQLLVAISETSDPFGSWMAYNFSTPSFPDYPKYGIWNDTYYVTTNENGSRGLTGYFINREDMLNGVDNPRIQRLTFPGFPNGPGFFAPPPVDWSGFTPPPATTNPMIVLMKDDAWGASAQDEIDLFSIDIDWDNPSNTVTTTTTLVTTPFDSDPCSAPGFGFACVPQRGGNGVDGMQFTVMNQVHYYNFGSHESIVLNFLVDATPGNDLAGIRWMELRKVGNGDWTIHQEGTYAPDDGLDRYGAATAIDAAGNIGMVFAASSEEEFIGLRMTGRRAGDPLGEMTAEEYTIVEGASTNPSTRFADYVQMAVDPFDGRTFWFTGEFADRNGMSTRIVAFNLGKDTTDMGVVTMNTPQNGTSLGSTETVEIEVKNFGLDTPSTFQVGYIFENGTPVVDVVNLSLLPDSTYTHTFTQTVDMSAIGDYSFKVFTALDGDNNTFNDTLRLTRSKLATYDAAITGITGFSPINCGDRLTVELVLTNFAGVPLTSANIDLRLNNNDLPTINWMGNLMPGESVNISQVLTNLQANINTLEAEVSMPNGQMDEMPANDNASADFNVVLNGEIFRLVLELDNSPEETTWELRDEANQLVASGGPYEQFQARQAVESEFCLDPEGCYTFTIFDSYGDGLNGGNFTIYDEDDNPILVGANQFGFEEARDFCADQSCLLTVDVDATSNTDGVDNGVILISLVNFGPGDYVFSIDGGTNFDTTNVFTGLAAGVYNIVVTNNEGCEYTGSIEITSCALAATVTVDNNTNGENGTIIIRVNEGAPTYEYSLDGSFFQILPRFSDRPPGEYLVYIRDQNCTIAIPVIVGMTTGIQTTTYGQILKASPNPTTGIFQVKVSGLDRRDVFLPIYIYDINGRLVQATQIARYDNTYVGEVALRGEPDGTYFIRFLDEKIDRMLRIVKQK